jgi:hypothetical protein
MVSEASESPLMSAFSPTLPAMQIRVDATSLSEFKLCPRRYQLRIIEGWRPLGPAPDLQFGLWYHAALELFDRRRAEGAPFDEALDSVLEWLLKTTWMRGRPWYGTPYKNRFTLIRGVMAYLDRFGRDDPLRTLILRNGKPAVELSFEFDSGYATRDGEPITLCGHMDRIVDFAGGRYVLDRKTTKGTLGPWWAAQWAPHNQFSLYILAAKLMWGIAVRGLIVDGMRVAAGFEEFRRVQLAQTAEQGDEWLGGLGWWLKEMEKCARQGAWPMADSAACGVYGGCPFRSVCAATPGVRDSLLRTEFVKEPWDPTIKRGE